MIFQSSLIRRAFLVACIAGSILAATGSASASPDAEVFTQRLIDEGVAILRNTSDPMRRTRFRDFITQYADVRRTAQFTLGQYYRGASPAEFDEFVEAFKNYAIAIYESQLDKYKGESLKVVDSLDTKPGETIVKTVVDNPNARDPLRIWFRLSGGNGSYKFFDIAIESAWLGISQKEQFGSILGQNRGSVSALTHEVNARTQRILAGMSR
jgi:phospholipid transport system substrate-binding protein